MGKIVEPPDIERIFDKPGRDWTPEEHIRVKVWLHEDLQLRYLLTFALRHLGHQATTEDAEDAWGEFFVRRLDAVIDNYDPTRGRRFWSYLLLSFMRHCWDEGERIRRERQRVRSVDKVIEDEKGERPLLVFVDEGPNADPEEAAERAAFLEALNGCLGRLRLGNSWHWKVFMLREIEELSEKETAKALGVPQGSVKGWLRRTRLQLRKCLQEKGWTP